jgi:uncharacterized membrane protein
VTFIVVEYRAVSAYDLSVAVHVIAVVLAFGPTFAYPFIQLRAERRAPAELPGAFDTILLISSRLAVPASLVVGATGAYQAAAGPYDLGDAWLAAGIALYLAVLAVALGLLVPRLRRARVAAARPGGAAEYARVRRQLVPLGALVGALVLATTALMELKPG